MNINELIMESIKEDMPIGINEVTFKKLDYRTDQDTKEVLGVFVHTEEWKPLYLPFFNGEINTQLGYLIKQLNVESYDPAIVNEKAGTKIKASRYIKVVEKNINKERIDALREQYGDEINSKITIYFDDGSVTMEEEYINVSFNPNFQPR